MNTNPERFYFVDNNRLALVEKNGTTTVDGASTVFKTISEAKPVRINSICKATHFNTGSDAKGTDYTIDYFICTTLKHNTHIIHIINNG